MPVEINKKAIAAAEKAYHAHFEGRPMVHAIEAYEAVKAEASEQVDEPPVSRDLVAKIRAAQFRWCESKGVHFDDSDLMCREEAQFIAREISQHMQPSHP